MSEDRTAKRRRSDQKAAKVLVIDDAAFFCGRVRDIVERECLGTVVETSSGKSGITLFHARSFDAVILDVALPDVDGLSILKVIRRLDPSAAVLVVTAAASRDVVRAAKAAGAAGVLAKPVEEIRLLHSIKRVLAKE